MRRQTILMLRRRNGLFSVGTYEEVWEIVVELLLFLNLRIFFIDGDFLSCVVDCEVFVSTRVVLEFPVSS